MRMGQSVSTITRGLLLALAVTTSLAWPAGATDWPTFGGDHANRHASPLTEIDR